MCRNIKTLFNFDPPASTDEVQASSIQFVRKLSGFTKPSKANEEAFNVAVERVAAAAQAMLNTLVTRACRDFAAEWAAVIDNEAPEPLAIVGKAPAKPWIAAFIAGSRASMRVAAGETGPDDVAWSPLSAAELTLVLGRQGRPFRARERRQSTALARIADARWSALVR